MTPKTFTIYRMKESCYRELFTGPVQRCATECGNRFRYLQNSKNYTNMECMQCGYKFHTKVITFGERYDEDKPDLGVTDPNLLFRSKELKK